MKIRIMYEVSSKKKNMTHLGLRLELKKYSNKNSEEYLNYLYVFMPPEIFLCSPNQNLKNYRYFDRKWPQLWGET